MTRHIISGFHLFLSCVLAPDYLRKNSSFYATASIKICSIFSKRMNRLGVDLLPLKGTHRVALSECFEPLGETKHNKITIINL